MDVRDVKLAREILHSETLSEIDRAIFRSFPFSHRELKLKPQIRAERTHAHALKSASYGGTRERALSMPKCENAFLPFERNEDKLIEGVSRVPLCGRG